VQSNPSSASIFAPKGTPRKSNDAGTGKTPRSKPGKGWRIARWGALALALLVIAFLLCTRGCVARAMTERAIGRALGADVSTERVVVGLSGRVVTEGLVVRVPGMRGGAGEVLRAARIEAQGPLGALLRGRPRFSTVTVDGLTARISQHVRTGQVNLAGLRTRDPAKATDAKPSDSTGLTAELAQQLPSLALRGGMIELGEHDDDGVFSLLKGLGVSGTVEKQEESGVSVLSLRQTAAGDGGQAGEAFIARGRIEPTGVTLTVTGIDFSSLTPTQTPSIARELFTQSMLEGAIPQADFVYSFDGSWRSRIQLAGVSMNLPVESRVAFQSASQSESQAASQAPTTRRLRLLNTSGTLELSQSGVLAELAGYVEELPYRVTLRADGPGVESAWTVTMRSDNFQLEREPEILRFVPPIVRERLADFGNPTGVVDALVTVSRAAQASNTSTQGSPVQVQGSLQLRDVRARFHKFPYAWEGLRGEVVFDESRVEFRNIRGASPSGASVEATVAIEPPTDEAGVDVRVRVRNLPLDERVREAMTARGQGRVLDELLDAEGYASLLPALLASGITQPPPLGGTVDVDVMVKREVGPESIWSDRVDIAMRDVLLMPKQLGYPLRAQRVTIVQEGTIAQAKGELAGLTGATLELDTTLDVAALAGSTDASFSPPLRAVLSGVPVDALLLAALERQGDAQAGTGPPEVARVLRELGVSGSIAGEVNASPAGTTMRLTARGSAAPARTRQGEARDDEGNARVDNVRATISLENSIVEVKAAGTLPDRFGLDSNLPGDDVSIALSLPLTSADGSLRIESQSLDLGFAVAPFIEPFAPLAAARTREVFARLSPQGRVRATVQATLPTRETQRTTNRGTSVHVEIEPAGPLAMRAGDASFVLLPKSGSIAISLDGEPAQRSPGTQPSSLRAPAVLKFEQLVASVNQASPGSPESATAAELQASGVLMLERDEAGKHAHVDGALVRARSVALAGSFTRSVLKALEQEALLEALESTQADGLVDVDVQLAPHVLLQRTQRADAHITDPLTDGFLATLRPRTLSLGLDGVQHTFDEVAGEIVLQGPRSGRVRNVVLGAKDVVRATADGAWGAALASDAPPAIEQTSGQSPGQHQAQQPSDALAIRATITAQSLSDHVRAMLPRDVLATLTELEVASSETVSLPDLLLRGTLSQAGASDSLRTFAASGTVHVQRASAKLGVPVSDARGSMAFAYTRTQPGARGELSVDCSLDGLRVLGVALTDGRGQLRSTPRGGVESEQFSAQVHGGRVSGALSLAPPVVTVLRPGQAAPGRWFDLSLEASNVRFAPLVEEGRLARGASPGPVEPDLAPDGSRGVLSGSLSLAGVSDDASTRRGRGRLTVQGGTVVSLPVVVPLLRVSNLQLPTGESLDYALADFFLRGEELTVEQLSLSSRAVGLYGFGTMRWPSMDLDLRFRAANRARIPILTAIIEGVREELVTTQVRGTLDNPQVSLRPLDGTRAMLRDLTGGQASDQERSLDRIEQQVTPEERRARPAQEEVIEPRGG
jgi:hypothetical protein